MTNFFCIVCRTAKEYLCIFEGNTMCNTCLDLTQKEIKKQQKRTDSENQSIIDNKYRIRDEVKSNK
jgi:hypothetical protein